MAIRETANLRLLAYASQLTRLDDYLGYYGDQFIKSQSSHLVDLATKLHQGAIQTVFDTTRDTDRAWLAIERSSEKHFSQTTARLVVLEKFLAAKDPSPWLAGGWTQLFRKEGVVLSSADVEPGDSVTARLRDGQLKLQVKEISQRIKSSQ